MTSPNDTAAIQQLALEIQIGDGPNCRIVHIPVKDAGESLNLQRMINKTPGKYIFQPDSLNPMTIHCGRVVFMQTVLLPPQMPAPVSPSKLARIN